LPIRKLAICVLIALAGATAATMLVQAQVPSTLALTPASQAGEIKPGANASFVLVLNNSGFVQDTVSIAGDEKNPAHWQYDVKPNITLTVDAGQNVSFAIIIVAPADAQPGNVTMSFVGTSTTTLMKTNPAAITLTISESVAPTPKPVPPSLSVSVSPSSAAPGEKAAASIVLANSDPSRLDISISAASPHAWVVRFPTTNERRVLQGQSVTVPIEVTVPLNSGPGSIEMVTITATANGFPFRIIWNVTTTGPATSGQAPPTPPTSDTSQPVTSGASDPPPTPKQETFAISVTILPSTIQIAPGESASAKVRLYNTGTQPLHLSLLGSAADNWPLAFDHRTLDLSPGDTIDAQMTLTAPSGIPAGGTGSGSVMVRDDSGLLRTSTFKLQIMAPATPRDTSKSSTAVPLPPATSPTFSLSPTTTGIVIGLGAVGASALVIAQRKPREKLLWLGIGLYTRLARPDVLGHPERDRLYRIVETQPGVHFHALQRELLWNTGTLTYHLRVLERHGFIVDRRDGNFRRFYIQGAAPRKELFNTDAPHGLRADVLEAIRSRHGISQSDLSLALGANKQTVNYHVKALERAGIIRVEKRGRDTFLYPTNAPGMGPGEVPA